jgi:outer membrane protein assembly factor BamB
MQLPEATKSATGFPTVYGQPKSLTAPTAPIYKMTSTQECPIKITALSRARVSMSLSEITSKTLLLSNLPMSTLVHTKSKPVWTPSLAACLWFALFWAGHLFATDWPQWRGPNRDAVWTETGIIERLPSTGLKVLWRAPIGMGYSSPVIEAGKVYLSDAELKKPIIRERVHCLEADSGKVLWTSSYETPAPDWFFTEEQGRGPGATPIARKGKVYALDLFGNLVCLETKHGKVVWKKDLKEEFQTKGTSADASPLIEGDLLILMLGGKDGAGIVALDRNTGREVWRALDEAVTWSSPIVIDAGGVRQLIVWTQQSVSSLNPANGKLYWREATSTGGSPGTAGVSTPVFQNNYLLVSGWMFQLEKDRPAAKTLWPESKGVARRILSDTSTGVLLGDHVYSAKTGGEFVCLKAATGEEIWKTNTVADLKNGASIQVTMHGDSAFLFNNLGELIQTHLGPGSYEEISRTKLIEPTSRFGGRKVAWAAPAFAHQNVYARNDQELICVSLAANSYRTDKRGK